MTKANYGALRDIEVYAAFNRSFNDACLNFRISFNDLLDGQGALARGCRSKYVGVRVATQRQYENANHLINHLMSFDQYDELRDAIFAQLYPIIKYGDHKEISMITTLVMQALARFILDKSITTFDELIKVQFKHLLFSSSSVTARSIFDAKRMHSIMTSMAKEDEGLAVSYANLKSSFSKSHLKSKKLYYCEIEHDFIASAITLR